MIKKDPDIVKLLYDMGFITKAELNLEESNYNDLDSDLEMEIERKDLPRDERIERIKNGIEHTVSTENEHQYGLEEEASAPAAWLT
jgi:microtubule-associated protein-like 6